MRQKQKQSLSKWAMAIRAINSKSEDSSKASKRRELWQNEEENQEGKRYF